MITSGTPGMAPSLLVGREREQGVLRDHLAAAHAGRGSLVLIGGEAGIGKTALADALCREAAGQGALVLTGHCYDLTETPPYGPWVELFEQYRVTSSDPPGSIPPLPAPFAPRGALGTIVSQATLFEQVQDFLGGVTTSRPFVLLLEDLHWADSASLDLLRHQARHLASAAIFIVATYRAEEVGSDHPLAALLPSLVREGKTERLNLQRLDDDAVRALLAARYPLPDADRERLVAYLQTRADGNPFFIRELLRSLAEESVLRPTERGWLLADITQVHVPSLVRQVITVRLTRLGEEMQRLLAIAAVIGQELPLSLWAVVADVDEETLLAVIERAIGAHILEETPDRSSVRFVHALIRETLYEEISLSQRRIWHRQIGEILATRSLPDPDAVAHHFRQAGDVRAAHWLVKAGQRAHWMELRGIAARHYEAALALLEASGGDVAERGWLLLHVTILGFVGLRYSADQAWALQEQAGRYATMADDPSLAARVLFVRGIQRCRSGDLRAGLADVRSAAAAIEIFMQTSGAMEAHEALFHMEGNFGGVVTWLAFSGRLAEARDEGERYLARPGNSTADHPRAVESADVWYALAFALALQGRVAASRRASAAARVGYRTIGRPAALYITPRDELAFILIPYQTDDLAERERVASEAEHAYRRFGTIRGASEADTIARHLRLPLLEIEGRWQEARDILEPGDGWVSPVLRIVRFGPHGRIARAQGRADLAWQLVHEKLPDGPATEPGDVEITAALPLQLLAVALSLDSGDLLTARAWLEAHDRYIAWSGVVLGVSEGQTLWAHYWRAAGDAGRAYAYAVQSLARASEPRQPLSLLAAHRLLGELGTTAERFVAAQTHLDAALALADACTAPYERALTLLAIAELRVAENRQDEAAALVGEARAICEPLDAKPALARADALMTQVVSHVASVYPAHLTEREVEVLRLIAAGHTNRQIADLLSLSERTVHVHVRNIFMKTHTDNRAGATAFAFHHGLA